MERDDRLGSTDRIARSVDRPTATYKRRRRKLSAKRQGELDDWLGRWGLAPSGPPLDLTQVFGRAADVYLDVGFGHGESTVDLARRRPDADVIGIEVHDPGVVTVLDAIVHDPLPNARVVHGDLLDFLDRLPAASLAGVHVFFPDPWPKARQQHRRLVKADVVAVLTDLLRHGGELRLASDIADYAAEMVAICDDEPRLRGGVVERPGWRPLTRFERRGLDDGRLATDLHYRRV